MIIFEQCLENTDNILMSVQVNMRTTQFLTKEQNMIVNEGYF